MTNTISTSTLTGEKFLVPSGSDYAAITHFLERNKDRKIVAVQGLGFVGTAMSLVVANSDLDEYAVIGVDRPTSASYWKIAEINKGICPIVSSDKLVSKFFESAKTKGNFIATHDANAFKYADVIIIDINLDVVKDKDDVGDIASYDVPLAGFKNAMTSIGSVCREDVLILVETTVPPGTCRKIIHPIIAEGLSARGLSSELFKLGHSYERVMRAQII